jgi:hypothetical protein
VSVRLDRNSSRAVLSIALAGLAAGAIGVRISAGEAHDSARAEQREPGCGEQTAARFTPVLHWHASHYSDMQVEDVYKLLHQSVAGPAHAIEDPDMARQWLDREWEGLGGPFEEEEMFDPLSGDGRLVRVNLRPWRAAGRAPEAVLNAFVRTAGTLPPDTAKIRAELDAISACADRISAGLGLSADAVDAFFGDRAREGYPAIHHSETYERTHRPAYRVVIRDYLD